jgi:hypothetical protein
MVSSVVVIPPSGLPAISPTRGEISWVHSLRIKLVSLFAEPIASRGGGRSLRNVKLEASVGLLLISLLVGEMPGRAEGGNATLLSKQGGTPC